MNSTPHLTRSPDQSGSPIPHPFLSPLPVTCLSGRKDALENCVSVLHLLADLFGGDNDSYSILNTNRARQGMFIQLYGVANVLEAVVASLEDTKEKPDHC